jgi:hypothetical protein
VTREAHTSHPPPQVLVCDADQHLTHFALTQIGMSTVESPRPVHDFWTTLYLAIDD